ncbi:hypothetical protein ACKWTF_006367 [Chironomus riparius]
MILLVYNFLRFFWCFLCKLSITLQHWRWVSSIPETKIVRGRESQFISQFVPHYGQKDKFILNQNIFKLEDDYKEKTADQISNVFEELSYECEQTESSLTEGKYDKIIDAVIQKLPEMNDDQVVKVLVDLYRFPQLDYKSSKYHELWNAIDSECWERSRHWRYQQLLKVMNAWYRIGITKNSKFNHKALMKLSRRLDELPPRVLVEMMFYQSIIRHKDVPMYYVESRLEKILDDLTIDELGIVCLAFFKTESKLINGALMNRIYRRVIDEIDDLKDITFANILKTLRYSSKPSHCIYMNELFEKLLPIIDRFGTLTCLHIALLGTNLQNCNKDLIEKIVHKYNQEVTTVRLKDLDRISLVIALFDIQTESGIEMEFLRNVLEELKKRVDEIVRHPRCFTSTVHYLAMKGIYDIELIQAALKESFVTFAYGKNYFAYSREILCIDGFTKINLKDIYKGPQLSDKIRKGIATFSSHYIPYRGQPYKLTHGDKLLLDVQELSEIKYGKNILTQAIPHFERPDILYCFDENRKSVTEDLLDIFPPRDEHPGVVFSKEHLLSQKPQFADNMDRYKMIAIVIGGWNFYLRETRQPTGVLRLKLDQLRLIGYTPILIYWHNWANKPLSYREELLDEKMNEAFSQDK